MPKTIEWKIANSIKRYCNQIKVFCINGDCWSDTVLPKELCGIVVQLACLSLFSWLVWVLWKSFNMQTKEASSKIRKCAIALTVSIFCQCSMLKWWMQVEEPWGLVAWLACLHSLKIPQQEANIKNLKTLNNKIF